MIIFCFCRCLLLQRPDLKVILMSATINIKLFSDYFNGEAPVIQVPGRLHPIKVIYKPIPELEKSSASEKINPAPYIRILQQIDGKYPPDERGDLLIFLSGIKEITIIADACREYSERVGNKWIVLPLHSTLSLADQDKVFDYAPDGVRKCIVSTNIAETSVTIDGVRFVIDSGKVKEMQYDAMVKMRILKEFWISRASAEQRKGRAGRTGPGVCFRLFGESEFQDMAPFSTPEIHRSPLDSTVLQMVSMGLADARKFPFLEPPTPEALENAISSLKEVNAMNRDETLTITGQMLAKLPVDVSIGKMLIMGTLFHQVNSVLTIAASLSVQSPFTNDSFNNPDCMAARRNLDSDQGDPITLMNAYREWLAVKAEDRESSRRWCRKRGLEEQRFYEMTKLRQQFKDILETSGLLKSAETVPETGTGRTARHGEMKRLKSLKREYHMTERSRKTKKLLTVGHQDSEEPEDSIDIKDIEFRLRNDAGRIQQVLTSSMTSRDLLVLKLILCSGLYPQLAIADEFNSTKGGLDHLYHTRVKPFNVLHPNSIFASNPEYLEVSDMDVVRVDGVAYSPKHQVLVYMSLLETNKPYVVNSVRMPALQTLLLFCHSVESDGDFGRLVFDSWIEMRFADVFQGQVQISKAVMLRQIWKELADLRFSEEESDEGTELEMALSNGLVDFVHSETAVSIRRLLPGDLKVIYNRRPVKDVKDGLVEGFRPRADKEKGGVHLSTFLLYDCLESRGGNGEQVESCPLCGEVGQDVLQRMRHLVRCLRQRTMERAGEERREKELERLKSNPSADEYRCPDCKKTFYFTPIQLLRHKNSHRK